MTKVIFQIGLLSFCVAAVLFGLQHTDLLEIVARSFVVFIAVVGAMIIILLVVANFAEHKTMEPDHEVRPAQHQTKPAAEAAK
ncbi:MAG TPA: hypothetical protein VMG09_14570 [Bacteroidota bacterium]|nr:hypothetical protein [Bacteroidota bacterium]